MPVNGDKTISALTFGTLLSSQESDAHRVMTFQPGLRGNLRYSTGPDPPSQDPIFLNLPPALQLPARVRRRGSAKLALGGSERPAAFASRASLQQEEHYVASR
jgi:hypothetical protein